MNLSKLPVHVAIIMDGNGRWAKKRGLSRVHGHVEGVKRVEEIVRAAKEVGIKYLTLFAFSTENWRRPPEEVNFLMGLLKSYVESKRDEFLSNDIRFNAMGRLKRLPNEVYEAVKALMEDTRHCESLVVTLALNYGGRAEMVDAFKKLAKEVASGRIEPKQVDEELISKHLYCPWIPEPDLLIRTSGEMRISNFMLWQLSYTELYFTPTLWPDFTKEEFYKALEDYSRRERRFGGI